MINDSFFDKLFNEFDTIFPGLFVVPVDGVKKGDDEGGKNPEDKTSEATSEAENMGSYKIEIKNDNGEITAKINDKDVDWADDEQVALLQKHVDSSFMTTPFLSFFNSNLLDDTKSDIYKMIEEKHQAALPAPEPEEDDTDNNDDKHLVDEETKKKYINDLANDYVNSIDKNGKMSDKAKENIIDILTDFADFVRSK